MKKEMDKIADYLLLRSSYMQELGLFHGKMGVVVALYLYADAYGDEVMREYAWELFQQVYDGVHTDMPVGLERGLAGIGYGTTLLCKRGLVECSLNDILEDIDRKIMERDPRRLTDMSVRTGGRIDALPRPAPKRGGCGDVRQPVYDGVARHSGKEQSALPGIRCHGRFERTYVS